MIRHPFVPSDLKQTNLLDDRVEVVCARCSYPEGDQRHFPSPPDRLFTCDDGETMWSSVGDVIKRHMEYRDAPTRDLKVEEFTVVDPVKHLCSSDHLIDIALDWASDDGEIDEVMDEEFRDAAKLPHVIEAFEKALRTLAGATTYRMADELVATHNIEVHVHPGGGWSWSTYLDVRP